jgi:hypothetical protein
MSLCCPDNPDRMPLLMAQVTKCRGMSGLNRIHQTTSTLRTFRPEITIFDCQSLSSLIGFVQFINEDEQRLTKEALAGASPDLLRGIRD